MSDTPTNIPTDKSMTLAKVMDIRGVRPAVCLILFAIGVTMFTAQSHVGYITGGTWLSNNALELVDEGMESNQKTFLIFSAIKGTLAVIEGSTVGVGFEVEVGDLIQPVYDYVDYFWNIFLVSFVVMGFYKVLLDTELFLIGYPIMGMGLMTLAVSGMLHGRRWNAAGLARKFILLGLLMIYALPISLMASREISDAYVSKLKTEEWAHIEAFHAGLYEAKTEFIKLKEEISIFNPGDSMDKVKDGMITLVDSVKKTFETVLLSFMYYVLIILFEILILPFCTAFLIYLFARRLLDGLVLPNIPSVRILPRITSRAL
jgi:hypothetical protein